MRGVWLGVLLLPFAGLLAGCDSLETLQFWDTKKKLPGAREEVFPGGVPGVQQGIPPELVKGYQAPQEATTNDPAVVAARESAEKVDPKAEERAKPKPKPKVAKVSRPKPARPRPAPQQAGAPQQPPPVQQAQGPTPQRQSAPWPDQQPPQAAAPAAAPWPNAQPQAQPQPSPWPGSR
jgi:hypothetical protein